MRPCDPWPLDVPQTNHTGTERNLNMSMLDALRKGFSFFLMSMGVSSPAKKPAPKPAPKPESGK